MPSQSNSGALVCPSCGKSFVVPPCRIARGQTFCSRECQTVVRRANAYKPLACIYTITHLGSGRLYVGSTGDVKARWKDHRQKLRRGQHKNALLQEVWLREGPTAFAFEIVERVADTGGLRDAEQQWLDRSGAGDPARSFNIDFDARGRTGRPRAQDAIERSAAAHRGRKRPAETGAKIRAKALGRPAHNRHFTMAQVAEIRARLAAGESNSAAARAYGVSVQLVWRIAHGISYPPTE